MITAAVFWTSTLTLILFCASVLTKGAASIVQALLSSLGKIVLILVLTILIIGSLSTINAIENGIAANGFMAELKTIVMWIVVIALLVGLVIKGGSLVWDLLIMVLEGIRDGLTFALEWAAKICEKYFMKALKILVEQIDKC